MRPLLPGGGPHKVLVTSRHTLAGLQARLVDVTVLDQGAAIDLLDAALQAARPRDDRISGDRQAAGRLAGLCGGLPLALQIVGALLKADPALSAMDLADQLAGEQDRLAALQYDDGSGSSRPSVAAAFELSYRRLSEAPSRVFRLLPVSPGPDLSAEVAAVLADLPTGQARRVLAGLAAAHLIEAAAGYPGRWRMHDLVRLYAERLSDHHAERDGRDLARDRLLGYYVPMAEAASVHMRALPGVAVPPEFTGRDEALEWLDAERASLVAAISMAAGTGRDRAAVSLFRALAPYMDWRRLYGDWLAMASVALEASRRLGDRNLEADALGTRGSIFHELRRFDEAITDHKDAAAIYREVGDRNGEGSTLSNLGLTLRDMRRFDEALAAHQQAIAIFREIGNSWDQSVALDHLGLVLREVLRFDQAIAAHRQAAAIFRHIGDQNRLADSLTSLGIALREARQFAEAITACEEAVAISRQVGARHNEGNALEALGLALRHAGRFKDAVGAHQNAAAIYRDTDDRHGEGCALSNLSDALGDAQRWEDAITASHNAAAIMREIGDRHGVGMVLLSLSSVLAKAGRLKEAITAGQDAIAVFRETSDRPREALALDNLGVMMRRHGQMGEAITANGRAVAICREIGDRYGEANAQYNLGLALHDVRRTGEAITAVQEAAVIFQETGDLIHSALALRVAEAFRANDRSGL